MPVERIARAVSERGLAGLNQKGLDALKREGGPWIADDEVKLYRRSLYKRDGILYLIASVGSEKKLYLVSQKPFTAAYDGIGRRIGDLTVFRAGLTSENAELLHEALPFTAPVSLRRKKTTIGCGDRLGMASAGHIRAARRFEISPVLAQQSIRELTLTSRDYRGVVRDVTFLVLQEGFERGYGADGDHLKTIRDIDTALNARMPMITLDLTDVMAAQPASWSAAKIDEEFDRLDGSVCAHVREIYAGKVFAVRGSTVSFDQTEAKRCALMYWRALDFAREVDRYLREKRADRYDLEISIDETTAPTLPAHHLFIAKELVRRGVAVSSLAPRFVGEFQKGIDYIGDVKEFETQFRMHCAIAQEFGSYKISIHSGSDKFSVYPSIGAHTGMRLHLKTAGTSWLEAVRVIARADPALFRQMLRRAFACFADASKLYRVTTDLEAIPDVALCSDAALEKYLNLRDSRQLLHITYGGLLNDREIRPAFFRALALHEEEHYAAVEAHITKHIQLLGVPAER